MSEFPKHLRSGGFILAAAIGGAAMMPAAAEATPNQPEGPSTTTTLPSQPSGLVPGDKVTSVRELQPVARVNRDYRIESKRHEMAKNLAFIYSQVYGQQYLEGLAAHGFKVLPNTAMGTLIRTSHNHLLGNVVLFNDKTDVVELVESPVPVTTKVPLFGYVIPTMDISVAVTIEPIDHGRGVEIDLNGAAPIPTPSSSPSVV